MKKIIIFLIAVAGLAFLEPRTRSQIMNAISPLSEASHKRSALRALEQMAMDVQRSKARTGSYPQPSLFRDWLLQNDRNVQDPWGSEYYFELFADSFVVGSLGPDARMRTVDDIRVAERIELTAAGLESAFTPPAPPPSSVKSRAVRAAEAARKRTP
ncbi:MAG: hypothetical protein JSV86_21760 [Gemmatimonadota bacterium]|nr:MAG: hypothetical protein JSV86_21760 [Gemmatimonadota bacterium]